MSVRHPNPNDFPRSTVLDNDRFLPNAAKWIDRFTNKHIPYMAYDTRDSQPILASSVGYSGGSGSISLLERIEDRATRDIIQGLIEAVGDLVVAVDQRDRHIQDLGRKYDDTVRTLSRYQTHIEEQVVGTREYADQTLAVMDDMMKEVWDALKEAGETA